MKLLHQQKVYCIRLNNTRRLHNSWNKKEKFLSLELNRIKTDIRYGNQENRRC